MCISLLKKLETGKTKGRIWGGRQRLWGLTQLCYCLSQSHEAIGSDVSLWDPLLSAPAQYSRCTQVACPPLGAPGLHRPRVGYNLSRIPVCLRRRKTWAMSQSESPKRWQSGRGVVTALPAASRAPRRDLVRGDSGRLLQATAKDLKQLLRSPELHSPGKGLCGQWPQTLGWLFTSPCERKKKEMQ